MRGYTVAAAAVTLKVPQKWIDNALSHHSVRGVSQARQGIARRLTPQAVTILEIALRLIRTTSIPLGRALALAQTLIDAGGPAATLQVSSSIMIVADISAITAETRERLAHAVESAPTPKRGRPRR